MTDNEKEPFDYRAEFDRAMILFPVAAMVRIEELENHLNHVETVAPLFLPSEYMRGAKNLEDQREALRALGPFVRAARKLQKRMAEEPR